MKKAALALVLLSLVAPSLARAADDGSQLASPFRLDYLGYLQHGPKVALFLSPQGGSAGWALVDAGGAAVSWSGWRRRCPGRAG